jgi:hypothetical protein
MENDGAKEDAIGMAMSVEVLNVGSKLIRPGIERLATTSLLLASRYTILVYDIAEASNDIREV